MSRRINSVWFFTADWHLCHANIIKSNRRDFLSESENSLLEIADRGTIPSSEISVSKTTIEAMNNKIIDSTNDVVEKNDSLVILGDFCWTKKFEVAKSFRDRINCKNVYLVWGNHDRTNVLSSVFNACYHQYLWTVNGQKIFTSHFPCRVWDRSHHGSWMLYGHCHNSLWHEDNFQINPESWLKSQDNLLRYLDKMNLDCEEKQSLLKVVRKEFITMQDFRLTLDVGVDNRRLELPFGTPWSFEDIQNHMRKKRSEWFSLLSENFQD
jgi:calcineurin-like phosphoesterase family protein